MPRIAVDGMKFYYQQAGTGPDVVLIHGVTGNLAIWPLIDLITILSRDFRVTAYDLRGHGYSDTPLTGYTSADMAEDLFKLQQALGLGPSCLLGHSFGGVVAHHAAVLHPEAVAGVILSDPYFPGLRHLEANITEWEGWDEFKQECADAGMEVSETAWYDVGAFLQQAGKLTPENRARFIERLGEPALQRLIRLSPTTCGKDVAEVAGLTAERIFSVTQPVLCLYGEHSPFLATCYELHARLPNCKVALVPGSKHRAHEENGPGYVALVQQHLREMAGIAGTWQPVLKDEPKEARLTIPHWYAAASALGGAS
jgi:pimeloyl-ACP methyl ester carboxylesterase